MFKKVLTTTVLGVSVLGVMAANAAAPGVYVTGQVGYANTHMGSKTTDITTSTTPSATDKNLANNDLAGRLAIGYQFNPNFAVEAGYLQLDQKKVNIAEANPSIGTLKLRQNAIDLVGKGIIPVSNNVNVYGKLGVAYISSAIDKTVKGGGDPTTTTDLNNSANIARHKWAPEAAVGVSYDITPNVSLDTSWTHIQPLGSKKPGNIDFVAVGVGYNFG